MSIRDLLTKPFEAAPVRASELGRLHRRSPANLDFGLVPLAKSIGQFVARARQAIAGPDDLAVERATNSLESYIDQHSTPGFKDQMKLELTKRWLSENSSAPDLVAVCNSEESGIDPVVVGFVLGQAQELGDRLYMEVVGELSLRVLSYENALNDPVSALAYTQSMAATRRKLPELRWLVADLVDLHEQCSRNWAAAEPGQAPTTHQLLHLELKKQLLDLGSSPRHTVLLEVARCSAPAVQEAVLKTAALLGQVDPEVQTKIEVVCGAHKVAAPEPVASRQTMALER